MLPVGDGAAVVMTFGVVGTAKIKVGVQK